MPGNTLPYAELPHHPPPGFRVRNAESGDVSELTRIWYAAFNSSHAFFRYATPDDVMTRKWFDELWRLGIAAGPGVMRTFVVEDLRGGEKKIVALSRWHVPQADGNQDIPMPAFVPEHWGPDVMNLFWGGMARSRERIMGRRQHWMAEFIAIDQAYQHKDLAFALADWGFRQARAAGLEIYGDATTRGLPVWKHYGCERVGGDEAVVRIPARPGGLVEDYEFVPVLWSPGTAKAAQKRNTSTAKL